MSELQTADIARIQRILPHRFPFLLIDRVERIDGTRSALGIKNVTMNEPFFAGHFPGLPVMPGVLIVEAMAQTAAVLVGVGEGFEGRGMLVYFMAVDGARFRRKVTPGDRLEIAVETLRGGGRVWKHACKAHVDGALVAEAQLTAMIERPGE